MTRILKTLCRNLFQLQEGKFLFSISNQIPSIPLLGIIILLGLMSCSDTSYDEIAVLPLSTIEYTETVDEETITEVFTESPQYKFDDLREYLRDSCHTFQSSINMEGGPGDSRIIRFLIRSVVPIDKMDDSKIIFRNPQGFVDHLEKEFLTLVNLVDPCELREDETAIQVISGLTTNPIIEVSAIESGEVLKYDLRTVLYQDLGYVLMNAEFNFVAQKFLFPLTMAPENVPVNMKLQHAIRFPEIDK